jgi:hypothetical protein
MKNNPIFIIWPLIFFLSLNVHILGYSQSNDSIPDKEKKEEIKKGLSFGALPVIGYNTDLGLQYGLVFNLFGYGDGSSYPDYKYSLYTEISRTTKGGGINQVFFDSKHLLPGKIRLTADLSYLTMQALNFYGFNGYDAVYNKPYEDDTQADYISRMFYRHERKFTRFTLDFTGRLKSDKINWFAGIGYFDFQIRTVDINKLNKGKADEDLLPDTTLLYDKYINWGIINENEKNGGVIPSLKAGIIYDTRDIEANPNKGIWSEAILFYVPKILGNKDHTYLKLAITHRQYFTLISKKLSFAYRLGYQGTLSGKVPFYMQPYMITSFSKFTTTDGLGGAKTIRGILQNRVVGDGITFSNFEFRWKFYTGVIWKQNIYLALNAFADGGMVLKRIDIDENIGTGNDDINNYFDTNAEKYHWALGGGFRIALNENFIVAADVGKALDERDGKLGIYIGIGYLF